MKVGHKNRLKNFLTYTRSERNGTIVLSSILLIIIIISIFLRDIIVKETIPNTSAYERIDSFFSSLHYIEPEKKNVYHSVLKEELPITKKVKYFYFDPNSVSIDSLVDLGLSPKQAQVVINYRNKGGQFKIADDLSKIHVIDSFTFQKLKPWVKISSAKLRCDSSRIEVVPQKVYIELNSADTVSLTNLKGIGRSFARRIVAYRDLLGGFYNVSQLSEVYGLSSEVIGSILPNIWVDSTAIKHLNLNLVSYEDLKNHPYLTDYQAKAIVYYRSKKGTINSIGELVSNKLIPSEKFNKVRPYFTVR
ncbi:competence protein ComEA [Tenuifilaceae bacterium CYCD]|nr:competence protein ComEA [Tenuifilaceae bacterium CYCD]